MFDYLKKLLSESHAGPKADPEDELQTAVAVLLIEASMIDGDEDEREESHIRELLQTYFKLNNTQTTELFTRARQTAKDSVEWQRFTSQLKSGLDHDGRIELIEMLWEVVYADGELHEYEASMMRRICGLLYVEGRQSAAAKKRALEKLNLH